ncbi:MAG TPA: phosphatase PAP2 family protein [Ilumatobacteraceae bacterium]|nr:phosphatase PAP2 family protein [Ilumatobacteraceae bacterium]HRB01796.1 phosphatase PAP2 family protein [Ilumatobacteraceae bacterium]
MIGWAALTLVWIGLGELIVGPLENSAVVRTDNRIARWMVDHRTPRWDRLSSWGSFLAETVTKVVVTALLALVLLKVWRRWVEPLLLAVSLLVEAAAFIVVTTVVGRQRPDVVRLDNSPVNSSFPSGHCAAAAAYAAIAIIVFCHTRKVWARVLIATVTALVPVVVALSRMYRGMHFLSDTIAGTLLGCGAVLLTYVVLKGSPEGARVLSNTESEPQAADEMVEQGSDDLCPS